MSNPKSDRSPHAVVWRYYDGSETGLVALFGAAEEALPLLAILKEHGDGSRIYEVVPAPTAFTGVADLLAEARRAVNRHSAPMIRSALDRLEAALGLA